MTHAEPLQTEQMPRLRPLPGSLRMLRNECGRSSRPSNPQRWRRLQQHLGWGGMGTHQPKSPVVSPEAMENVSTPSLARASSRVSSIDPARKCLTPAARRW